MSGSPSGPKKQRVTRADLERARNQILRDVIAPDLKVLLVGINPSLYSAAVGHHFARPGNRFWRALHEGGWTDRELSPYEDRELIRYGYGVTNIVARATARADELTDEELREGARRLRQKVVRYRPRCVALVGISAYRIAFNKPAARMGPQPERLGDALVWVLPNPSGLNAHYQREDFARLFRELLDALSRPPK